MWERLAAMAATPRNDAVLETTVKLDEDTACLHMKLENLTENVIRVQLGWSEGETVLVRDAHGTCLLTNRNAEGIRPAWGLTGPTNVLCPRGFVAADGYPRSSKADGDYPLQMVYPLRNGTSYTVLAAVNLTLDKEFIQQQHYHTEDFAKAKDFSALVVAKPVTFSVPGGESSVPSGRSSSNSATRSVSAKPFTFDEKWEQASRFAGKPFEGLLLDAVSGKPTELKAALHNRSDKTILVKKWKGDSDYEILVRDLAGNPVGLTDKGKKFFQSGELLEIRRLEPGETVNASLPLADLFAMRDPGEYTVLVSLPVLGDVDAVLTAKPVKVRIGMKRGHD